MHLLAISGSLRAGSSNSTVLEAARLIAPDGVEVRLYDGLGALPAFNPDLDTIEGDGLPPAVAALRGLVGRADGVLICSPEYAHGIPGSLKNALDWLVGSTEFPGKPVGLLSTSARSVHAQAQLVEVLTTMNARLVSRASVMVPLPSRDASAEDIARDAASANALRAALDAFRQEQDPARSSRSRT